MNVHPAGRPNVHNNLFDFKGLSSSLDYGLACEAEVDKSVSVLYNGLKFENQVSILRLLSISLKAYTLKLKGKKISSSLRPLITPLISRNQKLTYQNNRIQLHCKDAQIFFFYVF